MEKKDSTIINPKISVIVKEAFYFFSALLVLGAIVETLFPGLFSLFVNAALIAAGWLISLILLLLYVRR
ncbi:hypothetical protein CVU83_02210 [Candidatus Falkowbacteria bacterium HGW-Falkowbacteria-2]|uniref:Uncharacterized protein n=1 Tax=Candidatus Falkowbacteria bacterium HGW-Falkowbacteria-2 TaxID=2013769 RepID=A0A2N2E013_9BACT|nr:MAG: hypothetical protein CVU83_02210 [Candidatus Falkowbacteria bacterium HGW-Falkowbacteria-2]